MQKLLSIGRWLGVSVLLVSGVMVLPCLVFWICTGNATGLCGSMAMDAAGVRIQVDNKTVDVEKFLIFVISVDYLPDMEEQALKAFAVAARSSLYAHMNSYLKSSDRDVMEAAQLGIDYYEPGEMVCAFEQAAEQEGNGHWSEVYQYVKEAVESTAGQYLSYTAKIEAEGSQADGDQDGTDILPSWQKLQPVDALWHENSAGKTRYYQGNLTGKSDGISLYSPVLKSMDGKDRDLVQSVRITVYTRRELAALLWELPGTEDILEEERLLSSYFIIKNRDSSGCIEEMSLGNRKMTGEEAARLLQVSSGCFYVSNISGDRLKITVYGSGRGYGMSLAGASVLAAQGADYKEILEYYFPVCQLNNISVFGTE